MPLYLNELSPWERRNEYYKTIQLGKGVKEQTHAINNQTQAMVASQLASTSAIIVSQERISEGINGLVYGVDRVEQGIYGLKSAFEWGISEVVWQIEQNRAVLRSILEILMAPLDTQAKERRKRAEEAFANGWIDDAEEEFLESEKLNKFDFSIHISLGIIYLFSKIDKQKALSYFEKAIKYAKPKSSYHASYALLHKALIKFDFEEIEDAEKSTSEAIDLSPDFAEALYQNAQHNAQLKKMEKSTSNLEKAIKLDEYYCLKASNDPLFDPIRPDVDKLFVRLRDEQKQKAEAVFTDSSIKYQRLNTIVSDLVSEDITELSTFVTESEELHEQLTEIKEKLDRNSYFDYLDINKTLALKFTNDERQLVSNLKHKMNSILRSQEQSISKLKNQLQSNVTSTSIH